MKKIISILAALMMCLTLSSCVATASAQIDEMYDDVDISLVVTYGTPYYNTEGLLLYYIYRDMFYYPYYYHNRYYLHRYSRPLPPERMRMYKPVPRDFYHNQRPPHRHHNTTPPPRRDRHDMRPNTHQQPRPNVNRPNNNVRPNVTPRPNNNINRGGNMGGNRPTPQPRSSTRATVGGNRSGGGHVGGRR